MSRCQPSDFSGRALLRNHRDSQSSHVIRRNLLVPEGMKVIYEQFSPAGLEIVRIISSFVSED